MGLETRKQCTSEMSSNTILPRDGAETLLAVQHTHHILRIANKFFCPPQDDRIRTAYWFICPCKEDVDFKGMVRFGSGSRLDLGWSPYDAPLSAINVPLQLSPKHWWQEHIQKACVRGNETTSGDPEYMVLTLVATHPPGIWRSAILCTANKTSPSSNMRNRLIRPFYAMK